MLTSSMVFVVCHLFFFFEKDFRGTAIIGTSNSIEVMIPKTWVFRILFWEMKSYYQLLCGDYVIINREIRIPLIPKHGRYFMQSQHGRWDLFFRGDQL